MQKDYQDAEGASGTVKKREWLSKDLSLESLGRNGCDTRDANASCIFGSSCDRCEAMTDKKFSTFAQFRAVLLWPYDMDLITFYEFYGHLDHLDHLDKGEEMAKHQHTAFLVPA